MLRNPTRRTRHTIGLFMTLVLLVGVLVAVAETPGSATVPGANGKIAYARGDGIWTMNADGSGQTALSSPLISLHHEPAWSPDGSKILYREDGQVGPARDDIVVVDADGPGSVNLTNTSGVDEFEPTWSPDGTKIAYRRSNAIWTMNADGSHQTALTSPGSLEYHSEPAWSPDGTKVAYRYVRTGSSADIAVMNADGTGSVNLTNTFVFDEFEPTWSPDGTRIAYERDGSIWTMNAKGGDQTALTTKSIYNDHHEPAWSPDGTKILYRSNPTLTLASDDIIVINTDGTGFVNLTSTAGIDESNPTWQSVNRPPVAVNDSYPTPYDTALNVAALGVLSNDTDPDGDTLTVSNPAGVAAANGTVTMATNGSFTYTPNTGYAGTDTFTYVATDGTATSNTATVTIAVAAAGVPSFADDTVGLVAPSSGEWYLRDSVGAVSSFYYGNPGDYPFVGDWDCDGTETPGLYRQSDGFAYLRDSNTQGVADVSFFFGNPGDVPIAGDFNADGCDTLSIYRPSNQRFYVINELGQDGGGLGAADYDFLFGNPGDTPVVGDWDGDATDEIGLYRESSGFFYYRDTLTTGVADGQFYFGNPGDRFVAGDWGIVDGRETPGLFRPSNQTFYFRYTLTQGNADAELTWAGAGASWLPVSGNFNLD